MTRFFAVVSLLVLAACAGGPPPTQPPVAVCPPAPAPGSGYYCAPKPPAAFCRYLPAVSAGVHLLFGGDTRAVADDLLDAADRLGCRPATVARMSAALRRPLKPPVR